jgi:CheY-like chemotaxis protein
MVIASLSGVAPVSVLTVDDDEPSNRITGTLLKRWGYIVAQYRNGPDALAWSKWHLPEAVLLDLAMPGMDGCEIARQMRRHPGWNEVSLIALTCYGDPQSIHRSLAAGFDVHVTKPVPPQALRELLDHTRLGRSAVRACAAELARRPGVLMSAG